MMDWDDFSKAERRQLRALAELAYERELTELLRHLAADFAAWKGKSINAFDVADAVRETHNTIRRELMPMYDRLKPPLIVAGALERGILAIKDVPAALRRKLSVPAA